MIQFYNCICLLSVLSRHCWDQTETSISDCFWMKVVRWHCPDQTGTRILRHLASLWSWQQNLPTLVLFQNPVWSPVKSIRWAAKNKSFFIYLDKYICAFSILLKNTFCKLVLSDRWWKALYEAQKLALPLEKDCSQMSRKCPSKILYTYKTTFYRHSLFFF